MESSQQKGSSLSQDEPNSEELSPSLLDETYFIEPETDPWKDSGSTQSTDGPAEDVAASTSSSSQQQLPSSYSQVMTVSRSKYGDVMVPGFLWNIMTNSLGLDDEEPLGFEGSSQSFLKPKLLRRTVNKKTYELKMSSQDSSSKKRKSQSQQCTPARPRDKRVRILTPVPALTFPKEKEEVMAMSMALGKLQWTLRYAKYNPAKTNEELVEFSNTTSEFIQTVLRVLSRINLGDLEYEKILEYTGAFFELLRRPMVKDMTSVILKIHDRAENVFDAYLDYLSCENVGAMEQLLRYDVCTSLAAYGEDVQIRKILTKRLLRRIRHIVTRMMKMNLDSADSQSQNENKLILMDPAETGLYFYYCQLLELVITTFREAMPWIDGSFYKELQSIFMLQQGSFLMYFQNLSFMFYGVLHAAKPYIITGPKESTSGYLPFDS